MAELTKAQINAIASAYKKQSQKVKNSVNWQKISDHYDVGEVDGSKKWLYLTAKDRDILQEMVQLDYGLDVRLEDCFNVDRHQLSKRSHKEKWANIRPEASYVLVKQLKGYSKADPLIAPTAAHATAKLVTTSSTQSSTTSTNNFTTPSGPLSGLNAVTEVDTSQSTAKPVTKASDEQTQQRQTNKQQALALLCYEADVALRVPIAKVLAYCQQANITQVIVVENLDSFDCIAQMNFDDAIAATLNNSLFVYRGGGVNSPAGCKALLQRINNCEVLSKQIKVTALTDLDAAGIQIATLLKGCQGMIVPQWVLTSPEDILSMVQVNDINDDHKQARANKYLQHAMLHNWQGLVNAMQQYRISVKQQHILTHAMCLTYLPRKKQSS
ncbi:hypothetical protein ACFOD0_11195 [Shewanella intestini]|uniref:DUF7281 domain-containing protein n=1 Tax=Shewanella intestini TaxID=2017544 RepID=A0ABS5I2U2_9GAMM|nr:MULTISPECIES: hypothetical protein [Shewanella]MBR9728348.1 hypothetical protein [Shewanella intestini]MRG36690.1 hypothetical protein [Shewanella sp. XMDDZSB0408]